MIAELMIAALSASTSDNTTAEQPDSYALPGNMVYPEGIASSPDEKTFYVGSTTDGSIRRGNVATGEVTVLSEGGETAVGVAADEAGRLWVAGGETGQVYAIDAEKGELLQTFQMQDEGVGMLNDVSVATDGSVFITDTANPVLHRISATPDSLGEAEAWLPFEGTPLVYDTESPFPANINLNGIVATPDGYLLVVQTGSGQLWRISQETKEIVEVQLDSPLKGDGLALEGQTLYAVVDGAAVVSVTLSDDLTTGTVGEALEPPTPLLFPTTLAFIKKGLLVVNGQVDVKMSGGNPKLPFTVTRLSLE